MTYYQLRQGLIWSYKKSEGNLKIISTITFDIDTTTDKEVTKDCSGLVDDIAVVIDLTVVDTGTQASNPVTKIQEIIVENIGTNKTKSYVQAKILAREPIVVQANCFKEDIRRDTVFEEASEDTALEYGD